MKYRLLLAAATIATTHGVLVSPASFAQSPAPSPAQVPAPNTAQVPAQLPTQLPTQLPAQLPTQLPTQLPAQLPEPTAPKQLSKPDLAKAQQTATQVCAACHGADGNSASPANPSLAGQHAEYITLQLLHFQSGIRANAVMQAMAAPLTPDDMRSLGMFFAQQKAKPSAAKDKEMVAAGQKIYRGGNAASGVPACAACHSPDGAGIPARYPRVGGQYSDYTLAQLKAFKAGGRGADKDGKDINGKVMAQIASRMSDRDMQAVAEYAAGLR